MSAQELKKVGVIGVGLMGSGIAHVNAVAGIPVVVTDVTQEILEAGLLNIQKNMERQLKSTLRKLEKEVPAEELKRKSDELQEKFSAAFNRITGTMNFEDFKDCDLIVEVVKEDIPTKREVFKKLDAVCKPDTVFASNTSSIPIAELSVAVNPARRKRFIGLHHFNPVPLMDLVEVVRTFEDDPEVIEFARQYCAKVGKQAVLCKDTPAFIVNYLLVPFILDAIRLLENEVSTKEDIDKAIKLGLNHPMGPFELLDFVGLDTTLYIADIMYEETKDARWASPSLLRRMVSLGYNGRKSGRGFYDYPAQKK